MAPSRSQDRRCHELADRLQAELARGLSLSRENIHFLHSTYGIDSSAGLSDFLAEEPGCDQESILECLVFPDPALRCRLEPLFQEVAFHPEDVQASAQIMAHRRSCAALHWPGESTVEVEMTRSLAATFISRLKIHRRLNLGLSRNIEELIEPGPREKILVRLRDLRVEPDEESVQVLISFTRAFPSSFAGFEDYLDFVCRLLEEKNAGCDFFTQLILTRLVLEKSLDKAKGLETMMARQPVEAILMQKTSILSIDKPKVHQQLQMIEDIGLRLFGSVPDSSQLQSSFELRRSAFED